jgi:hypothetical protein
VARVYLCCHGRRLGMSAWDTAELAISIGSLLDRLCGLVPIRGDRRLSDQLIDDRCVVVDINSAIERRQRLGGVLSYYYRTAAETVGRALAH